MRFFHYSDKKVRLRKRTYSQEKIFIQNKPVGLWFSVEEIDWKKNVTWKDFCVDSNYRLERLNFKHSIEFFDDAKILTLSTIEHRKRFTKRYEMMPRSEFLNEIDWNRVKKDYQAIVIAPYSKLNSIDSRLDWYYGWDCSSGCVWDLSALKKFKLV